MCQTCFGFYLKWPVTSFVVFIDVHVCGMHFAEYFKSMMKMTTLKRKLNGVIVNEKYDKN